MTFEQYIYTCTDIQYYNFCRLFGELVGIRLYIPQSGCFVRLKGGGEETRREGGGRKQEGKRKVRKYLHIQFWPPNTGRTFLISVTILNGGLSTEWYWEYQPLPASSWLIFFHLSALSRHISALLASSRPFLAHLRSSCIILHFLASSSPF